MSNSLFFIAKPSRQMAVVVFFWGVCLSGSDHLWASCGDYLLAGHGTISLVVGHQSPVSSQSLDVYSHTLADRAGTAANSRNPKSPCASGRCHQFPIPALPESPGRGFYWKPFAFVFRMAATDRDKDSGKWGLVGDDWMAPKLFLAVGLRPPEAPYTGV